MKTKRAGILLLSVAFVFLFIAMGYASDDRRPARRKVVQISGLVVTGDSLKPVPFANIWVKNTHRGTVTDFYGYFNIAVRELDTLRISSVGYDKVHYVIPDTLLGNRYSLVQVMTKDTIILPETVIYPWPSREQFKHAFLYAEIPDDDYERAMKNLARAEMKERMENMPMDGSMNFRNYMNNHNQQLYYAGQAPPMRIFDPFAWAEFFKAWREGRFRRDN